MTAISYPVAADAQAALAAPLGRAARRREAELAAGADVAFVVEPVGASFTTREAALDAWRGHLDDDRGASRCAVAPADRFCALRCFTDPTAAPTPPMRPVFADGRRWPEPKSRPRSLWRLTVSYWRIVDPSQEIDPIAPQAQARRLRRDVEAAQLDARALAALVSQPLRPMRPQQPLDVGLFEVFAPEDPQRVLPDE